METTTNKLKMQLKSAQSELEQTRNTLKSMEGSDGHGMLPWVLFFCVPFRWSRCIKIQTWVHRLPASSGAT